MNERSKLLKKAVLTGVGATTSVDRIKAAMNDAMEDLLKVGHDLLSDLESEGKVKASSIQDFLKNLQKEATKRGNELEKTVSSKVHTNIKKAAKDFGLITREDYEHLQKRLTSLEKKLAYANNGDKPSSKNRPGSNPRSNPRSK